MGSDAGSSEWARKVKDAHLSRQMRTTSCCCWPCGVVGDVTASFKHGGKSIELTPAAYVAVGIRNPGPDAAGARCTMPHYKTDLLYD